MDGPQCIECGGFNECNHGTDGPEVIHVCAPGCDCDLVTYEDDGERYDEVTS